jgi:two-component system response regulator HydG
LIVRNGKRVLVVDDEEGVRKTLSKILEREAYRVYVAATGQAALDILRKEEIHAIVTDLKMPGMDGLELLKVARTMVPEVQVILITGHGTVETAVEAMKDGAYDFVQKPFNKASILKTVRLALEKQSLVAENRRLHEQLKDLKAGESVIGQSAPMRKIMDLVDQVAPSSATVMIQGESGTGKEVIAQAIHDRSGRSGKPFVKVSCAALPETLLEAELFGYERGAFTGAVSKREGRFEIASEGTLFLDEVGDIDPAIQVKLLRVLQSGEFERLGANKTITSDARLIAATNTDLKEAVQRGMFREDLYYRLNVINITMPPLRERREDVALLANHFLNIYNRKNDKQIEGFTEECLDVLTGYGWPGNVRELENAVERAVVLARGNLLEPSELPPEVLRVTSEERVVAESQRSITVPLGTPMKEIEKQVMEETLKQSKGNKKVASRLLGISARTLYRRLGGKE